MYAPGDVRVEEREEPRIVEPTDALIRVSAACVCGSDLWPYRGLQPIDGPTHMGHEYCGMVEEVGSEVTNLSPGDRVALVAPNVVAFPVAYYAILRLGAVVVPMNPLLKAGEVAYTWADCGARVAVVFAAFAGEAQAAAESTGTTVVVVGPDDVGVPAEDLDHDVVERAATDTAVILYTSGTTGRPKGAELSFANLRSNTLACV